MKLFKLVRWPDLQGDYQRTAHRRMLHRMSQRYASVPQLIQESGLPRTAVLQFLDVLEQRDLLSVRDDGAPDSRFGNLGPVRWFRRTFHPERQA